VNISWVVRTVEGVQRPVHWSPSAPVVPHERFVVSDHLQRVLELPAVAAVIFKARQIPAEVRSLLQEAITAESIFQVRVNLNLFCEFYGFDLDEGSCYSLHITLGVAEGDSSRPNWILVPVRINPRIHDSTKEIIENVGQSFSVKHAVKSSYEHRFAGPTFD